MTLLTTGDFIARHRGAPHELREERTVTGTLFGGERLRLVCAHCRVAFLVSAAALRRACLEDGAHDGWMLAEGSETWL